MSKKKPVEKGNKSNTKWGIRRTSEKKSRILKCLEKFCTVSEACEKVGINRKTFYEWLDKDKKFNKEIEDLDRWNLHNAEGKLNKLVNGYKYNEIHLEQITISRGKGKKKIETPATVKKTIIKEVQPNERAIEFLTTNRNRKRWKNRQELTGEDGEPIAVNILKFSDVKVPKQTAAHK